MKELIMFKIRNTMLAISMFSVLAFGGAYNAQAGIFGDDEFTPEQMSQVKITIGDAIKKSLVEYPGTITSVDLEDEDGTLVYAIDYLENGEEVEMLVDAITGEVMSGEDEDNEGDEKND